MQMRGVNQPNEKSDSADSVQHNLQTMAAVAGRDLEWGPGHGRKTFSNIENLFIETRWIVRLCLVLGRKTFSNIESFIGMFFFFFSFFYLFRDERFRARSHRCSTSCEETLWNHWHNVYCSGKELQRRQRSKWRYRAWWPFQKLQPLPARSEKRSENRFKALASDLKRAVGHENIPTLLGWHRDTRVG